MDLARDYLDTKQVAEKCGVITLTVQRWRERGVGPVWEQHPSSGAVLYPVDRFNEWFAQYQETGQA